ncbi:MAG: Ig-like domain-containing protein, partial [Acidobacteriota bacterium]
MIGVVNVELGPEELAAAADFVFALDPAPVAGSEGLLLHVVQINGEWRYRVVAELEPDIDGWATRAIDPLDAAWPGLRSTGTYALVELTELHGVLRGVVQDNSGAPAGGVHIESAAVDWLQISNADGSYALPLPHTAGTHDVEYTDPDTGDGVIVQVPVTGARVDLTPSLQAVGPYVLEITPADGAVDVLLGALPTVRFSEPVLRSSLDGEIELIADGSPISIELDHQGDLVRLLPLASLLPDTAYEIHVGNGVIDLAGHSLVGALATGFTTEADPGASGDRLDRSKIRLTAPDANGEAVIEGLAGAVPSSALVYVENQTSFTSTETVTAGVDGSFTIQIAASLNDQLLLHVVIDGSSEDLMVLGPFQSTDGRAAWVSPLGADFTSVDGYVVSVEPDTFTEGTWVRIEPADLAEAPIDGAPEFEALHDFTLDFGGASAQQSIHVTVPVSAGLPADGDYQLHRFVDVLGQRGFML